MTDDGCPDLHRSHENTPQPRSVAQLAAAYVALFEKIRPEGSYLLGGASFGGAVALEMARILQARGRQPLRLFLADPPILDPIHRPGNAELLAGLTHVMDYQRALDQYQGMTDDNMAIRFLEIMDMGRRGTRERDKAWVFRFLDIYRINLEAFPVPTPALCTPGLFLSRQGSHRLLSIPSRTGMDFRV